MRSDLFSIVRHPEDAKQIDDRLMTEQAQNAQVWEAAAQHAWRAQDRDASRARGLKAYELGSRDPGLLWLLARLLREKGSVRELRPVLQRLLDVQPDQVEATLILASESMQAKDYPTALASLRRVRRVTPEQAPSFFHNLSVAAYEAGDKAEATKAAERLKALAKTPEDATRAEQLLAYVSQDERLRESVSVSRGKRTEGLPPEPVAVPISSLGTPATLEEAAERTKLVLTRVTGTTARLECLGDAARLHLKDGEGQMVALAIPDPTQVQMRGIQAETFDFVCGEQKPRRVSVEYLPGADKKLGTPGAVRVIEFLP